MSDYSLPGANVLLLGASGSGKTHSLGTLPKAGIETFILFTEPGMRTVVNIPCSDGLHWKYIPPAIATFETLLDNAKKLNDALDLEALTKQKQWNKKRYTQFMEMLMTLNEFVCERCGGNFGCIDEWHTDRAIVIDSLSGLSIMAMDLAAGAKPVKSQGDWGAAMGNLEVFLNRMCSGTECHFVLTAHLEREKDEITGGIKLMASTLGQKLAPKVPRYFDDVVLCDRDKTDFFWSTAAYGVDLKGRNLPNKEKMAPDFRLIIDSWKKAGGRVWTPPILEVAK